MKTRTNQERAVPVLCVDTIPGTGKTEAAIAMLIDFAKRLVRGEASGTMLYVAPTKNLLNQTFARMRRTMDEQSPGSGSILRRIADVIHAEDQRTRVRVGVAAQITQALDDGKFRILFITHEAFLTLKDHPEFENTTVVFDEDRQWVSKVSNLKFSEATRPLFDALFKMTPLSRGICQLIPQRITSRSALRKTYYVDDGKAFAALMDLHARISPGETGTASRLNAYGALRRGKDGVYYAVQVEVPSKPFVGFKKVYILSANFTRSQMWHLLYRDQSLGAPIQLQDYSHPFIGEWAPKIYQRRLAVVQRYKKVVIIPLLANNPAVLTSTAMGNGFVAPELPRGVTPSWFKKNLKELRKLEQSRFDSDEAEHHVLRRKFKVHASLPEWLLGAADRARVHWLEMATTKRPQLLPLKEKFLSSRPLVFMNYSDMERMHPEHDPIDDGKVWLKHGLARGMNAWSTANTVYHLAAINCDPIVRDVLELLTKKPNGHIVEEYDANFDYLGANLLQCAGRGNIRNHDSSATMLVVVPTITTAEYLKTLMDDLPTIYTGFIDSNPRFVYSTISFGGSKDATHFYTEEEKRRLNSLKVQIHRAGPDSLRGKKFKAERDAIQKRATLRAEDAMNALDPTLERT